MTGWLEFFVNVPLLQEYGWRLIAGLQITGKVVGLSCAIGFVLAWPISMARLSRYRVLSAAALSYVTLFRGTPLLCQLYLVYYGAGELRPTLVSLGVWWFFRDAFYCCIFAFSLNTASYQAEIFRGAILAVGKGQREAAAALGLSRWQAARLVVLPQALAGGTPAAWERTDQHGQGKRARRDRDVAGPDGADKAGVLPHVRLLHLPLRGNPLPRDNGDHPPRMAGDRAADFPTSGRGHAPRARYGTRSGYPRACPCREADAGRTVMAVLARVRIFAMIQRDWTRGTRRSWEDWSC